MALLKAFLCFAVYIQAIFCEEGREARYVASGSDNYSQNVVKIDLSQCSCSSIADCDLTIIKSSLMEIDCAEGENLCCPITRSSGVKENDNSTLNNEEEEAPPIVAKPSPVTNIRVYTVNSLYSADDSITSNNNNSADKLKSKTKSNCRCKSRNSCPPKYIDYGFGFHCSYSTVRCCIPDEDLDSGLVNHETSATNESVSVIKNDSEMKPDTISFGIEDAVTSNSPVDAAITDENVDTLATAEEDDDADDDEITSDETETLDNLPSPISTEDQLAPVDAQNQNTEGELMIMEVTNWTEDDYNKELQCSCLPINQCRTNEKDLENSIERRRDTLCPGDFIQCCGVNILDEITKKNDEIAEPEYEIHSIKQELPPYQQPVQLPESNVTAVNNQTDDALVPNNRDEEVAPPSLPDQYQNYEQQPTYTTNNNNGYNNYPQQNTYPTALSGPQNYQQNVYQANGQNIRPWVSLASPSSYNRFDPNMVRGQLQGYPRGHYAVNGQQEKPSKPGGLFDTLTKLLG